MKKIIALIMLFLPMNFSYALDVTKLANIKINISGLSSNNRFFLCVPNVGCLSLLAAKSGKVYSILHEVDVSNLYLADAHHRFRVYALKTPESCRTVVGKSKTITIQGQLVITNKTVRVDGLNCRTF